MEEKATEKTVQDLDPTAVAYLMRQQKAIGDIQGQIQGALQLLVELNKLTGNWVMDWADMKLKKQPSPASPGSAASAPGEAPGEAASALARGGDAPVNGQPQLPV